MNRTKYLTILEYPNILYTLYQPVLDLKNSTIHITLLFLHIWKVWKKKCSFNLQCSMKCVKILSVHLIYSAVYIQFKHNIIEWTVYNTRKICVIESKQHECLNTDICNMQIHVILYNANISLSSHTIWCLHTLPHTVHYLCL